MNAHRSLVVNKLISSISNEKKAKNIEISIFNWVLSEIPNKNKELLNFFNHSTHHDMKGKINVKKSWDNAWFKKMYFTKARSILFNLNDINNPSFKDAVLNGSVKSKDIAKLSSYDMNNAIWDRHIEMKNKQIGLQLTLLYLNGYIPPKTDVTKTSNDSLYSCQKCSCKDIDIFQLQTRSADEPMTIFFTCKSCEFRWKDDGKA